MLVGIISSSMRYRFLQLVDPSKLRLECLRHWSTSRPTVGNSSGRSPAPASLGRPLRDSAAVRQRFVRTPTNAGKAPPTAELVHAAQIPCERDLAGPEPPVIRSASTSDPNPRVSGESIFRLAWRS